MRLIILVLGLFAIAMAEEALGITVAPPDIESFLILLFFYAFVLDIYKGA